MRIAVTGSSGYIGSAYVKHLLANTQNQVYGLDRIPPSESYPERFKFIQIELSDASQCAGIQTDIDPIDVCVHLAAARGDWAISESEYFRDNAFATRELLKSKWGQNVRKWIFTSSVSVYGHSDAPKSETSPPNPNGPYGHSKLIAEQEFRQFSNETLAKVIVVRPSAVFSPGHPRNTNVYKFIEALRKHPMPMFNGGVNKKSLTYLPNLISMFDWAVQRIDRVGQTPLEIFNYVETPTLSVRELAKALQSNGVTPSVTFSVPLQAAYYCAYPILWAGRLIGRDLRITPERVIKFAASTDYSCAAVRQEGFAPQVPLDVALRETARWHLTHIV